MTPLWFFASWPLVFSDLWILLVSLCSKYMAGSDLQSGAVFGQGSSYQPENLEAEICLVRLSSQVRE